MLYKMCIRLQVLKLFILCSFPLQICYGSEGNELDCQSLIKSLNLLQKRHFSDLTVFVRQGDRHHGHYIFREYGTCASVCLTNIQQVILAYLNEPLIRDLSNELLALEMTASDLGYGQIDRGLSSDQTAVLLAHRLRGIRDIDIRQNLKVLENGRLEQSNSVSASKVKKLAFEDLKLNSREINLLSWVEYDEVGKGTLPKSGHAVVQASEIRNEGAHRLVSFQDPNAPGLHFNAQVQEIDLPDGLRTLMVEPRGNYHRGRKFILISIDKITLYGKISPN